MSFFLWVKFTNYVYVSTAIDYVDPLIKFGNNGKILIGGVVIFV